MGLIVSQPPGLWVLCGPDRGGVLALTIAPSSGQCRSGMGYRRCSRCRPSGDFTWSNRSLHTIVDAVRAKVASTEVERHFPPPSEPQVFVGNDMQQI